MFLSKLLLNICSKQARTDLSNPYQLHATLCRAFARPEETCPRFLWRLEEKSPTVLVQSALEPHWERISERFPDYFAEPPQFKPIPLEHLQPGQVLRFRLKCNPTVTTRAKDGSQGEDGKPRKKRYGLYRMEDLLGEQGWLARQAAKSGFALRGYMMVKSERISFPKPNSQHRITLQAALYEGYLEITDLERFKATLATGLGHAKAWGFGLLSIGKG